MMKRCRPVKVDPTTKNYVECSPEEATHLHLYFPGPTELITLPVQIKGTRKGTDNWTWNGSIENPTLRPSVLCNKNTPRRCHSWVTDGVVNFLEDTRHDMAGQSVSLLDIDSCLYI